MTIKLTIQDYGVMLPDYLTNHHHQDNELLIPIGSTETIEDLVDQIDEALDCCDYGKDWVTSISKETIAQSVIGDCIEPIPIYNEDNPYGDCYRYLVLQVDDAELLNV